MAAREGRGIELDLELVRERETAMTAYEMLLSESQERMLIVAHQGREREVADIFRKWDLDAVVIGRVRDDGRMRVTHNGEVVCDVPVKSLTDEAPIYERAMKAPDQSVGEAGHDELTKAIITKLEESEGDLSSLEELGGERSPSGLLWAFPNPAGADATVETKSIDHNESLLKLLASPNLASKEWVYRQYDHMVRTNTVVLPGADAAVVRIKETKRAVANAPERHS